jgi:hypothetical protein
LFLVFPLILETWMETSLIRCIEITSNRFQKEQSGNLSGQPGTIMFGQQVAVCFPVVSCVLWPVRRPDTQANDQRTGND